MNLHDQYETVIGLEVHVQLSTAGKAFCGDSTAFGAAPNTQVSPISLAHPGTLPVVNEQQIANAVKLGVALGSEINPHSSFDRKNYFYADLPKGYQITQDRSPICIGGALKIKLGETFKSVRIHHIHMEEDAGKSIHDTDGPYSQIDLNRAGVPLLEVVTEPDLRSAEEVDAFMSGMRQLVRWLDVSDGNMEQGSMRCDVNVSVRLHGAEAFGTRCEIKNVNSMRYAKRAIAYEVNRQINILEKGGAIDQQTLNFDPDTGVTTPLRDKEDAHDYRYFPEPDMPPVRLSEDYIQAIKDRMVKLPWELYRDFTEKLGLSDYDASLLTEDVDVAKYFLGLQHLSQQTKAAANLIINKVLPYCKEHQLEVFKFPVVPEKLVEFIDMIRTGKVSNAMAYQRIFPELTEQPERSPMEIAQALNLLQTSDSSFLEELIEEILAAHPDKVRVYRNGKKGLLGFFMGELMKKSKGKADPKMANKMLREKLEA